MSVTLDISPQTEASLLAVAKQNGVDTAFLVEQLVAEYLPALSCYLQRMRNLHSNAGDPAVHPTSPLHALVSRWDNDDDILTDAEMEAEDRLFDSFERRLLSQPDSIT